MKPYTDDNFFRKIAAGPNGCHIFTGTKTGSARYGYISVMNKMIRAHRHSWTLYNGPIPSGKHVLHRCDVPSCVNPNHLFLGSHSDNMTDMAKKKRHNQSRKTHCVRGHEFSEENTATRKGYRSCRTCEREHQRKKPC